MKEGDQVLLLLPTKLTKLEMQWQGPFDIIMKVRENDYVINLDGQYKMFHANMMRKYLVRKTIDKGMVILCGCRHLEIATGGMGRTMLLKSQIPVKKGVMILNIVHSEPHRRWKMSKSVKISMKTSKGR